MAFIAIGLWTFLLFWSASAFWNHIETLGGSHQTGSKIGALAGEFALLALILLHCFDKHIGVRFWGAVLGFILAAVILVHAGALRGMSEATTSQIAAEQRMKEALTDMSQKQAGSIKGDSTGTQRERLAKNRAAVAQQAEIAKNAQREVAGNIAASADKVKDQSILPRWYLDGWCYSVIFILGILFTTIEFLLMMRNDIDADFNGVADKEEFPRQLDVDQDFQARRSQPRQ